MNKHKVFLPNGTIQTIIADFWEIDWKDQVGTLRFFLSPSSTRIMVAIFPAGGWYGMQDITVYEKAKAAV